MLSQVLTPHGFPQTPWKSRVVIHAVSSTLTASSLFPISFFLFYLPRAPLPPLSFLLLKHGNSLRLSLVINFYNLFGLPYPSILLNQMLFFAFPTTYRMKFKLHSEWNQKSFPVMGSNPASCWASRLTAFPQISAFFMFFKLFQHVRLLRSLHLLFSLPRHNICVLMQMLSSQIFVKWLLAYLCP